MGTKVSNLAGLQRIDRETEVARIKDFALDQLKQYIASGSVGPGQRLPSERELAERLGVGRNSLREAIKVLEAVGLVESRVGDGTYIVDQTGARIGETIGLALAVWGGTIVEILEARQMLEVQAASVAAEHATLNDLHALTRELSNMEAAGERMQEYLKADMNFHRLVAQAAKNSIVARIISELIDLLEEVLRESSVDQLPLQAEGAGTHRKVFEAIAQHNPAEAAAAMRTHLEFSTELWQAVISLGAASTPSSAK